MEANEAAIDARTMQIHHDLHHAAYVNNLNAAVRDHSALHAMPIEELLAKLPSCPRASAPRSATTAAAMPTTRCSGA